MVTTLSNTKNKNSVNHNHTKNIVSRTLWRRDTLRALSENGFNEVSEALRNCGCSFFVEVCEDDVSHEPRAIAKHCGLRICEECERRESYRKLQRYLPALQALLTPNPDLPDHFLFKMCLTTPYELSELTSASFKAKQQLVNDFLSVYFFWYFHERNELSKAEYRSGRCNLKRHGIGAICAAEFGERGKKLHWHFMMYAPFMPHMDIVAVWKDVTGQECEVADVSGIKARQTQELNDGGDIIGAVQEIVKYATKFTELKPDDVPHLYEVLTGNRRFRTFGVLYGLKLPDTENAPNICKQCGKERELISVGHYVTRCDSRGVPVDDTVADTVERGHALYFSSEPEISSGKPTRKARDALESASPC